MHCRKFFGVHYFVYFWVDCGEICELVVLVINYLVTERDSPSSTRHLVCLQSTSLFLFSRNFVFFTSSDYSLYRWIIICVVVALRTTQDVALPHI